LPEIVKFSGLPGEISKVAVKMGCAVGFDEQPGADRYDYRDVPVVALAWFVFAEDEGTPLASKTGKGGIGCDNGTASVALSRK
jgi:hypothetical protein